MIKKIGVNEWVIESSAGTIKLYVKKEKGLDQLGGKVYDMYWIYKIEMHGMVELNYLIHLLRLFKEVKE